MLDLYFYIHNNISKMTFNKQTNEINQNFLMELTNTLSLRHLTIHDIERSNQLYRLFRTLR